jgi:hypothetical protein
MTNNQLHGKTFEDFIKACGLFSGSADGGRSATSNIDIEAKFDKKRGLPTSIKATGSNTVELADAREFWKIDKPYRIIVGRYAQDGAFKIFHEVHEIIISIDDLANLRGELDFETVAAFHNGLLLNHFPKGTHEQARQWAKRQKKLLAHLDTRIALHPKIDSKSQRRLQCSVKLNTLIELGTASGNYVHNTQSIGNFPLPQSLLSSAREFGRR